jgi:hypothetical protein
MANRSESSGQRSPQATIAAGRWPIHRATAVALRRHPATILVKPASRAAKETVDPLREGNTIRVPGGISRSAAGDRLKTLWRVLEACRAPSARANSRERSSFQGQGMI